MQKIQYGSVCSGIEAATVAWHPLGMKPAWFAEIEPFPCAVLAHHYPEVPNHGDMTRLATKVLTGTILAPDVLVGGTPCQAFSVAGMRAGLADPRGALTIKYVELADAIDHVRASRGDPECVTVWENVPGVLSDRGNAFGCFLGALAGEDSELQPSGKRWTDAGCVYGPKRTIAWRVLDAQYFGLAQRRRRVFVVASARRGFDPCEVLFEREGVRRDTAPRRGQGQDLTGHAPFRPALQCGCGCTFDDQCGPWGCPNCEGDEGPAVSVIAGVPAYGGHSLGGSIEQSATLTAKDSRLDMESETFFVAPTIDASFGRLQGCSGQDANHGHGHLVVHGTQDPDVQRDLAHSLGRNSGQENAVFAIQAGALRQNPLSGPDGIGVQADKAYTLEARSEVQAVCWTRPTINPGFDTCATLDARTQGGGFPGTDGACGGHVIAAFAENSRSEVRLEGGDGQIAGSLSAGGGKPGQGTPCIAVSLRGREGGGTIESGDDIASCMRASSGGGDKPHALVSSKVRRLTPVECERLQGFPDDYTMIPYRNKPADQCPDGPRYKAIGNSKAVPVVRWIGLRLLKQL
ncbi:DNA cytosine methyltransferase [Pseudomonas capsici]|uniref:DNA cytosine methyltransferase n=1 Tax=Pseudomonas capsici TaxID=2810614 RepID=UPI0021F2462E|nr:DNA cytosine methyltransferase [Pseudomonas capsici]MCV4285044.1 DNA cytosine methyltransferase [Pseudomonas capsici]